MFSRLSGVLYFFFFKQKTAYEMRISDWSSDVCSSDLRRTAGGRPRDDACRRPAPRATLAGRWDARDPSLSRRKPAPGRVSGRQSTRPVGDGTEGAPCVRRSGHDRERRRPRGTARSEEHTTELQSLMRLSHAIFCLKQKKKH